MSFPHHNAGFIVHFKSGIMKWNAIITKSQYAKTLLREEEISHGPASSQEEDELQLLRILIKDYEERQLEKCSQRVFK